MNGFFTLNLLDASLTTFIISKLLQRFPALKLAALDQEHMTFDFQDVDQVMVDALFEFLEAMAKVEMVQMDESMTESIEINGDDEIEGWE